MNDDLLTNFRSETPMPDDETTQRIYQQATSGRRTVMTRRRLIVVAIAVLAIGGIAGGLSVALGGGGGKPPAGNGPIVRPGGFMPLIPLGVSFNHDGPMLTSMDVTVNNTHIPNATLTLQVIYSTALQTSDITPANTTSVFAETVAMQSTGATGQDATVSRWSGTLTPSDWTGGCQNGLYRVRSAVYATGTSVPDPWTSSDADRHGSPWITCNGVGATGPTGWSGPTGASGPTGGTKP